MVLLKKCGKVKALEDEIICQEADLHFNGIHNVHVGISHTRFDNRPYDSVINRFWFQWFLNNILSMEFNFLAYLNPIFFSPMQLEKFSEINKSMENYSKTLLIFQNEFFIF